MNDSDLRSIKRAATRGEDWQLVDDCRLALGEVMIASRSTISAAAARVEAAQVVSIHPAPDSGAESLLRYATLVERSFRDRASVTARDWRECAIALRAAASMCHVGFRGKYDRAAANCTAMVTDLVAMYGSAVR